MVMLQLFHFPESYDDTNRNVTFLEKQKAKGRLILAVFKIIFWPESGWWMHPEWNGQRQPSPR